MSKRDAEGKTDDDAGKKQKTGKSKPTCLRYSPSRASGGGRCPRCGRCLLGIATVVLSCGRVLKAKERAGGGERGGSRATQ